MQPFRPVALADAVVALDLLGAEHEQALLLAASGARDTYGLTRVPATAEEMRAYIEVALAERARGVSLPFATRDAVTGRVVGSTRFMAIEHWTWPPHAGPLGAARQRSPEQVDAVEIGSTWLSPGAQRTAVNTHAKLLVLTHAFEAWEVHRVTLKTDARNARSRAAIERIRRPVGPATPSPLAHQPYSSAMAWDVDGIGGKRAPRAPRCSSGERSRPPKRGS